MPFGGASGPETSSEVVKTRVVGVSEPPIVPGLSEMINEWQIAGTPEESQFFATEVGAQGKRENVPILRQEGGLQR